ncbi:MAG: DUF4412 domain-containing protein [Bacteroidales bacterium]|nr:DUF4412 domain-containing protein [Bacteroidales bacterium]HOY38561.1 DUF4412 domain-containing protein [Bacteroidales bacterium]HQP03539.1 DUF4412 domain-containing protein [Bacteroidales bacterium]
MKNLVRIFSLLLFVVLALNVAGQKKAKTFEGSVKYKIDVEGENIDAATRAQMPSEIVVYYKGDNIRTEMITPMFSFISLSNVNDGSVTQMFNGMGMKFYVVQTKEDLEALKDESEEKPVIKQLDETKVIAGYTCKKAEITSGGQTMEVYYTNELAVPFDKNSQYQMEGIDGIFMEYNMDQNGMIMKFSVKEVSKSKLNQSLFTVPSDYEKKSYEEFKTMFGG